LASAPQTSSGAEARPALRGLLGCEHAAMLKLSPEERERCEERMAHAGPGEGPARLNLDRRGDFGRNPETYLQRRPTKGCKARAAGDASVMGQEGVAAGVTCGWAF
jgi:hypothetical protein